MRRFLRNINVNILFFSWNVSLLDQRLNSGESPITQKLFKRKQPWPLIWKYYIILKKWEQAHRHALSACNIVNSGHEFSNFCTWIYSTVSKPENVNVQVMILLLCNCFFFQPIWCKNLISIWLLGIVAR